MITNELISEIKSKINDNQKQAITGGILQGVLVDMVNGQVLPKGTNLLANDLEDGIWLVTEPNNYKNPPSWFSGNGIALLVVDQTSNNVILIGHDGSSNELPAYASRYLSSTRSWRGAGKMLEEIFAKKTDLLALTDTEVNNIWDNN